MRDLAEIYDYIHADTSDRAHDWFNRLNDMILSLDEFPSRGTRTPELRELRELFFGRKPHIYRIIYDVDAENHEVNVLHIRHSARRRFDPSDLV